MQSRSKSSSRTISAQLQSIFERGATLTDDEFNGLALQVFQHQFANNAAYRAYCERRACTPDVVQDWRDIPAVPTAAFKEIELVAGDASDAEVVFRTSGTTRGTEKRGTHYVLDAQLYRNSLLHGFDRFVLRGERMPVVSLMPSRQELPESSLAYMLSAAIDEFGGETVASVNGGIDNERLQHWLTQKICLVGTSLSFLHWLENTAETYRLPAGSRVMDTGGFKGEKREISPADLRTWYHTRLGIDENLCINEYGMTELCSQYYSAEDQVKRSPSWLRFRVVDPDTLREVPFGERGILQHFDLANLHSVSAVLTEDLAHASEDGFVLHGRAPGAMPRGCSIAMDMLLNDASGR